MVININFIKNKKGKRKIENYVINIYIKIYIIYDIRK
jgi:hypothetical protein